MCLRIQFCIYQGVRTKIVVAYCTYIIYMDMGIKNKQI
jgi:hypothetical protein